MCQNEQTTHAPSERELDILKLFSRLAQISTRLFSMTRDELDEAVEGTSLSPFAINICRAYNNRGPISDRELYLINSYMSSLGRFPDHCAINRLFTNDEQIADAYKDMMKKHAAVYPDYTTPPSLEKLLTLSDRAMNAGQPRHFSPSALSLYSGENSLTKRLNCLFDGFAPVTHNEPLLYAKREAKKLRQKSLTACKVALIYAPSGVENRLEEFFSKASNKSAVSMRAYEPSRLLCELCEGRHGISVNVDKLEPLDILPQTPKEYRDVINVAKTLLTDEVLGDTVVMVADTKLRIKMLKRRALKSGLAVSEAISFTRARSLTLKEKKKNIAKVSFELLAALKNIVSYDVKVAGSEALPITPKAIKTYESPSKKECVYKCELDIDGGSDIYRSAVNSACSLLIEAALDGFSLDGSDLTLSLGITTKGISSEELGDALSVILGFSKVKNELLIHSENSAFEISESARATFSLRIYSDEKREEFSAKPSQSSLLNSMMGENTLPDLNLLRDFMLKKCSFSIIND